MAFESAAPSAAPMAKMAAPESDMEVAVLGHGELQGPFTELADLTIERDPRFPVRVTVQFYQATASGKVGGAEMEKLASVIEKVYAKGDWVGSLVVPSPEDRRRPTNWDGVSKPPPHLSWWDFPGLMERGGYAPDQPIGIR
jgi:hypothetical protein